MRWGRDVVAGSHAGLSWRDVVEVGFEMRQVQSGDLIDIRSKATIVTVCCHLHFSLRSCRYCIEYSRDQIFFLIMANPSSYKISFHLF
jgi:hypothetical protein